jgi:hypothetical protein
MVGGFGARTPGQAVTLGAQAEQAREQKIADDQASEARAKREDQAAEDAHQTHLAQIANMNVQKLHNELLRNESVDIAQKLSAIGRDEVESGADSIYGSDMDEATARAKAAELHQQNPMVKVSFAQTGVKVDDKGNPVATYTLYKPGDGTSKITAQQLKTWKENQVQVPDTLKEGTAVPKFLVSKWNTDAQTNIVHQHALQKDADEHDLKQAQISETKARLKETQARTQGVLLDNKNKSDAKGLMKNFEGEIVDGMLDGTIDITKDASLRNGDRLRYIGLAKQRDPNFNQQTYGLRLAMQKSLATGKMGDQVQSFNTFIGHAGEVSEQINNLRNTSLSLANTAINALKKQTGNPAVVSYLSAQEAARKEFETFLNNNHALHESDKEEGQKILNENQSPAQQQAAIKSFMQLALVRMEALNQRYKTVIGKDVPNLIEPDSADALTRLGFGDKVGKYSAGGLSPAGQAYLNKVAGGK